MDKLKSNIIIAVVCGLFNTIAYAEINFSSYMLPIYSYGWGWAWSDRQELMSFCKGKNEQDTILLTGTEFSFRVANAEDNDAACNNWAVFTQAVVTGNGLANKRWMEGRVYSYWTANIGGVPVDFSFLNSKTAVLGWYHSVQGESYYSEGTFGSPLGTMPNAGIGTFAGHVGYSNFAFKTNEQFARVDYARNKIQIQAGFPGMGGFRTLRSGQLDFNPENGYFTGEVVSGGGNAVGMTYTGYIMGYIGGANGETIHATVHTGSNYKTGIDFVLGQRVRVE